MDVYLFEIFVYRRLIYYTLSQGNMHGAAILTCYFVCFRDKNYSAELFREKSGL